MPAPRIIGLRQVEILLSFMEKNKEIAVGRVSNVSPIGKQEVQQKWEEVAAELNSVVGATKTAARWREYWNEMKYNVRKKVTGLRRRKEAGKDVDLPYKIIKFTDLDKRVLALVGNESMYESVQLPFNVQNDFKCMVRVKVESIDANHCKGGRTSHAPTLTPLEEKMAKILGRDVDPLEGSGHQGQSVSNGEDDGIEEERVEYEIEVNPENEEFPEINEQIDRKPEVLNISSPEPDHSLPASPAPSTRGQSPLHQTNTRNSADGDNRARDPRPRRKIVRVLRKPSTPAAETSRSAQSALEESRLMMLRIEELRAEAALKTAEAALQNAQSFRLIAQSVDRCSQMYFRQQYRRK